MDTKNQNQRLAFFNREKIMQIDNPLRFAFFEKNNKFKRTEGWNKRVPNEDFKVIELAGK